MIIRTVHDILENKKKSESTVGIYFLICEDVIVYVGQAADVDKRVAFHRAAGEKVFDSYSIQPCNADELNNLEAEYIVQFAPRYNVLIPVNDKWISAPQLKLWSGMTLPELKRLARKYGLEPVNGYYNKHDFSDAITSEGQDNV